MPAQPVFGDPDVNARGAGLSSVALRSLAMQVSKGESTSHSAANPISLTLTDVDPVTARIDNNVLEVTVRGKRFVAQRRAWPPMNVSIRYRLEKTATGMRFTMVDEPQFIPPRFTDGALERLSFREVALRRILRNRLQEELRETYELKGVTLPELGALSKMHVNLLVADNGWLTLACRRPRDRGPGT
jgi:hypothetical protein